MAPGPDLSAALARIDLTAISGFDVVDVVKARQRQLSHDHAMLTAAVVESGRRSDPEFGREPFPEEFAADEVRAALVMTRRAAEHLYWSGRELIERLPDVHATLAAGEIDPVRAEAFRSGTANLTLEQARGVCDLLLPHAPSWTVGQLSERIRRLAIALDPEWAKREHDFGHGRRKVVAYANPDGTATLEGRGLRPDRAAAIAANLTRLARAAKRAGDPRSMDQLRADLLTALTDGTTTGLDESALIEHVTSTANDPTPAAPAPDAPEARGADITVRVRISTLARANRNPGEVAGMGPIVAEQARGLVTQMGRSQWRFVLTDENGQLLHTGLVAARPKGVTLRGDARGSVELQVRECDLEHLTSAADGARWEPVLADIAKQCRDCDEQAANAMQGADDPHRRAPKAALRRRLQARDRSCFFMTCRAPATDGQIDHTVRYTDHGPTLDFNLAPGCVHDHRLKDYGGWKVIQFEAGRFQWTSRLGHHYIRDRQHIIEPTPESIPRDPGEEHPAPHTDNDPVEMLGADIQRILRDEPLF